MTGCLLRPGTASPTRGSLSEFLFYFWVFTEHARSALRDIGPARKAPVVLAETARAMAFAALASRPRAATAGLRRYFSTI